MYATRWRWSARCCRSAPTSTSWDHLIDWSRVPDDPIFQLVFPQQAMLEAEEFSEVQALLRHAAGGERLATAVNRIRMSLNPHPAGQLSHNVPTLDGRPLQGLQHKYRETVLFFPAAGQTCHAYCTLLLSVGPVRGA